MLMKTTTMMLSSPSFAPPLPPRFERIHASPTPRPLLDFDWLIFSLIPDSACGFERKKKFQVADVLVGSIFFFFFFSSDICW